MVGPDTLDVSPISNVKLSVHGLCPVPPVLDYQIDTLYIHHMQSAMKKVTERLKQLIFGESRIANWYEIFLTVFVLLMSLEQVYMAQILYLRRSVSSAFYCQNRSTVTLLKYIGTYSARH